MERLVSVESAREVGGTTTREKYTWVIKSGDEVKYKGDYKGFLYSLGLIDDINVDLEKTKWFTRKKGYKVGKLVGESNGLTIEVWGGNTRKYEI
jgi:hypothetical protein